MPNLASGLATDRKKLFLIVAAATVVVLIIAIGIGVFLFQAGQKKSFSNLPNLNNVTNDVAKGLIPTIETNPLENKPNINPADRANPIKNIKTNPFD